MSGSGLVEDWQSGKTLAECNLHMLTSGDSCDVSFLVGKDKKAVRGHCYVLISRSCVFHAMLCGPLADRDNIKIPDVEPEMFSEMLRYLYTNEANLHGENVTSLLYLAKKYAIGGLEHQCMVYLDSVLTSDNACDILEQAHGFDTKNLYEKALQMVTKNADSCLVTSGFTDLCHECMDKVVTSNNLNIKPEKVFSAALSWAEASCKRQGREVTPENKRMLIGKTIFNIYFPEMDHQYFVRKVVPSKVLSETECLALMSYFVCRRGDISPFKQKVKQAITGSGLKQGTFDVIFCENHRKSSFSEKLTMHQSGSSIDMVFNKDLWLHGLHLCTSANTPVKYEIRIVEEGYLFPVFKTWLSSSTAKDDYTTREHFTQPVLLQKARKYRVCATILSEATPYVGDRVRNVVELPELKMSLDTSNCGLVSGVVVSMRKA